MAFNFRDVEILVDGVAIGGFAHTPAWHPPTVIELSLHATDESADRFTSWARRLVMSRRRAQARRARLHALLQRRALS